MLLLAGIPRRESRCACSA